MELLPLCVGVAFCIIHVVNYLRKKFFLRRKNKLYSHVPALVGTMLTMMYYLYLNLTRSILDVFDCQPTHPSDGHLYMRTFRNPRCCRLWLARRCCCRCLVVVFFVLVIVVAGSSAFG